MDDLLKRITDDSIFVKIIKNIHEIRVENYQGFYFISKLNQNNIYLYEAVYGINVSDHTVILTLIIPEIYFGETLLNAGFALLENFTLTN